MPAITPHFTVQSVAAGGTMTIKPPAGETWLVHEVTGVTTSGTNAGKATVYGNPRIGTGTSTSLNVQLNINNNTTTGIDGTTVRWVAIDDSCWMFVAADATYNCDFRVAYTIAPAGLTGVSMYGANTNSGTVNDFRPPAGKIWILSVYTTGTWGATSSTNALTNGTGTITLGQYGQPAKFVLTNSIFLRSANQGASGLGAPTGAISALEADSSLLDVRNTFFQIAAGGPDVDVRPAVGEVWSVDLATSTLANVAKFVSVTTEYFLPIDRFNNRTFLDRDHFLRFKSNAAASYNAVLAKNVK